MEYYYTAEKNVQMLIYLMKAHGIKKVIASPGTTNITFVASLQQDPYFELYSVADERSAAYMACGLAAESGEPVVLSCTGATASRNYIPGLTEAYYRKLPVLAVTSTQHTGRIGQLCPQVIDRSVIQKDIAVMSVQIPMIHSQEDEWDCNVKLNTALLALTHRGGGPVHINLSTEYTSRFDVKSLPQFRVIRRILAEDCFPKIDAKRVGVFVGAHLVWSEKLTKAVDAFCEKYNGVVFCDHTSNYHGKYRVQFNLVAAQVKHSCETKRMDLLIDMGEMSGAYMSLSPREVWRVNPDGQVRDTWKKITRIFDMQEYTFFQKYAENAASDSLNTEYYDMCHKQYAELLAQVPELPFSNDWIAQVTSPRIPENSVMHLGILNTLRSWNFFEMPDTVICFCNTGGFGIDGIVSTFIGSALTNPDKLHFCVVGDLAFFYDLNAIANHNVLRNVRILLINNGCGTEFKNYNHFAARFGDEANTYMAAMGHYGQKSPTLVKNYATDLGFTYLTASNKEEYNAVLDGFVSSEITDNPILLEVFTNYQDESDALHLMNHIIVDPPTATDVAKKVAKDLLGDKGVQTLKRLVKG